ncbi:MAG TPA: chorismate lyase [Oxalicibacterium sp.]|nr:chorismate lyase [Oxalicibacterium sp.]
MSGKENKEFSTCGLAAARWFSHVNHVAAPLAMRHWLTDQHSLTLKLKERCHRFRVQPLAQRPAMPLADEFGEIALPRRMMVQERDVFLRCDERPMVFGHTIVPLTATTADWPFFGSLGSRSLGTTLFGDPRVWRGRLEFARLGLRHPLVLRALAALQDESQKEWQKELNGPLFARRCLYRRHKGLLLVTEVFLPGIETI